MQVDILLTANDADGVFTLPTINVDSETLR